MEQQIGSELGKEYIKAIYCHPAYLTYMQSQFSSVQLLSHVQLFATTWTAALQASLSIINSQKYSNSCLLSWWWTGRPGVLQSMWLQRARHDWTTEPNWTDTHKKGKKWERRQLQARDASGKLMKETQRTRRQQPGRRRGWRHLGLENGGEIGLRTRAKVQNVYPE